MMDVIIMDIIVFIVKIEKNFGLIVIIKIGFSVIFGMVFKIMR